MNKHSLIPSSNLSPAQWEAVMRRLIAVEQLISTAKDDAGCVAGDLSAINSQKELRKNLASAILFLEQISDEIATVDARARGEL